MAQYKKNFIIKTKTSERFIASNYENFRLELTKKNIDQSISFSFLNTSLKRWSFSEICYTKNALIHMNKKKSVLKFILSLFYSQKHSQDSLYCFFEYLFCLIGSISTFHCLDFDRLFVISKKNRKKTRWILLSWGITVRYRINLLYFMCFLMSTI